MLKRAIPSILIITLAFQGIFGFFPLEVAYGQEELQGVDAGVNQTATDRAVQIDQDDRANIEKRLDANQVKREEILDDAQGNPTPEQQTELNRLDALDAALNGQLSNLDKNAAEREAEAKVENRGCSLNPFSFRLDACIQAVFAFIGNFILTIMGMVLFLAGMILNLVLDATLVNMSSSISSITGINAAWVAIRDVANMLFIFSLLYIAISTILGLAGGATKRLLAHVIIAALLINFSLFFTKVVIDASNILAFGFYRNLPGVGNVSDNPTSVGGNTTNGMSGSIMGSLALQSIYDVRDQGNAGAGVQLANAMNSIGVFFYATLGGSIFILVTAIIFLMTAVLFIIRFVILIILMILSPLAFVGMILPSFHDKSKEWWDTLLGQALFAPALMMMIWVTLKIAGGIKVMTMPNVAGQQPGFAQAFMAGASAQFGIIMNFLIITIMLIASIVIANKISKKGSEGIMEYANRFQGFAGRNMVMYSGIRNIDEKFGESAFGNTKFGAAVREYSTGYMANQAFGGKMSAEEVHTEDIHHESERAEIHERNEYREAIKRASQNPLGKENEDGTREISPDQKIQIERLGGKIDQHSFIKMVKSMSKKERKAVSEHANWNQLLAVWNEKEGLLSKKEKIEILGDSRVQEIVEYMEARDKELRGYLKQQGEKDRLRADGTPASSSEEGSDGTGRSSSPSSSGSGGGPRPSPAPYTGPKLSMAPVIPLPGEPLTPPNSASVPFLITKKMEADLKARGYSQADINKMTPKEAWDHLNKP